MTTQLRLVWPPALDYTPESFIAGEETREAREALSAWRDWPARALALVGPAGSGKSHLASIWLGETGVNSGAEILEDADRLTDEMALFRLLERTVAGEVSALLLTARRRPAEWNVRTPDLASRLRALAFVEIAAPDDAALSQILRKVLRDRRLRVEDRIIDYMVKRIERSPAAALRAAEALDRAAAEQGGGVSLRLAAQVLETLEAPEAPDEANAAPDARDEGMPE